MPGRYEDAIYKLPFKPACDAKRGCQEARNKLPDRVDAPNSHKERGALQEFGKDPPILEEKA